MTKYELKQSYENIPYWLILEFIITALLTFAVHTHTTHWNWLKKHDRVPSLLAVHLQMLACRVMSHLITMELLFLLSSQGGYTMAYCQKVIRWRRAHTQMVLYFAGAAVPASDLQLPVLWADVASLVKTSRGQAGCWHQFSLGSPWQWRQGERICSASCTVSRVTK